MNIDRYNYEEYLILYMDNELDGQSRQEVEAFVIQNPDLKGELDMLMQSKITPDDHISFSDKGSLMRFHNSSVSLDNHQEWLISYIDHELSEGDKQDAEKFIAGNPSIQRELNLLQRAKLQPETIIFPDKESLYRKEEKARTIPMRWSRIAAAAVLLLVVSTTGLLLMNRKKNNAGGDTPIAGNTVAKSSGTGSNTSNAVTTIPALPVNNKNRGAEGITLVDKRKEGSSTKINNTAITNAGDGNDEPQEKIKRAHAPEDVVMTDMSKIDKSAIKGGTNNLPTPTVENKNISGSSDVTNSNDGTLTSTQLKKGADPVTPETADPYNNPKAGNSDIQFANEKSGGGLRGLLRKVTRTLEKRANIKATDDDDRLLIAGLAIKMN